MSMESHEEILRTEAYRFDLKQQITKLFVDNPHVKIVELARIFGAKQFLEVVDKKRGGGVRLNIDAFVEEQVRQYKQTHVPLRLPKEIVEENSVAFPPGEGEIITGSGVGIDKKGEFPRNKLFIELLSEHGCDYILAPTSTTQDMMRGEGYIIYFLPTLQKTVCVNNEEGNTTIIIFDTQSYQDAKDIFAHYTKEQVRDELTDRAVCVDWNRAYDITPELWKTTILEKLTLPRLPERVREVSETSSEDSNVELPQQETRRRKYRNEETAIQELEKAFILWKETGTSGAFNVRWLRKNGFHGLYKWIGRNGGIEKIINHENTPQEIRDNIKIQEHVRNRTIDDAIQELKKAFILWKEKDASSTFSSNWLRKNGFHGLYEWIWRNGGIEKIINHENTPQEIRDNIKIQEHVRNRTIDDAIQELKKAFILWKEKDASSTFSSNWLRKNGFLGLYKWIGRNGGIRALMSHSDFPQDIKDTLQSVAKK